MSALGSRLRSLLTLALSLSLTLAVFLIVTSPVSADTLTVCPAGPPTCDYDTIQDAVNAANGGDVIEVYPGTYEESVNLSAMNSVGSLTLVTVNNAGTPTPGTVTVDYSGTEAEFYTSPALDGNLTLDGFIVHYGSPGIDVAVVGGPGADRNALIQNVTATEAEEDGIRAAADGNVTISNCIASDNEQSGIHVTPLGGDAVITDCTANGNGERGITVDAFGPPGASVVGGEITITNCTADDNGLSGFFVRGAAPDAVLAANGSFYNVTTSNCTASGNVHSGFNQVGILGQLTIQDCLAQDNDYGVNLAGNSLAGWVLAKGNIICGNECGVFDVVARLYAQGNWWGCAGGPKAAGCDPICQADSIAVDFTPWISKISASATVDPVNVGEPTVVSFQFWGNPPAVYLGQGPGDLRGPAPFTVTTNNGRLNGNGATVQEFINAPNGTLKVTLVPDTAGTATVTVSGPCGLGDLEGATVVLGVVAAQEEFVPEPGTVLLLGSGLMGLAGYAGLRLRKR